MSHVMSETYGNGKMLHPNGPISRPATRYPQGAKAGSRKNRRNRLIKQGHLPHLGPDFDHLCGFNTCNVEECPWHISNDPRSTIEQEEEVSR